MCVKRSQLPLALLVQLGTICLQGVCIHPSECAFQPQPCHCDADHHQAAQNAARAGGRALAEGQNRQAVHGGPGWQ